MLKSQRKNDAEHMVEKDIFNDKKTSGGNDVKDEGFLSIPVEGQSKIISSADIIYEPIRKIDTLSRNRRKLTKLAHTLKRLSHEGQMDKFNEIVAAINNKCVIERLKKGKCVKSAMEVADIKFTALDAQIEAKRLRYDTSLTECNEFVKMEKIIKFTSDPTVSSMTYLARFGSAISMKSTLDNGLVYLQYAREHSEHVMPCKDTGMVYYIETNLMSQKYERSPSKCIKREVLRTIERAISHFSHEPDDVREDYERMLMLKMAYCYLGVGIFGNRINDVIVTEKDRRLAKNCIDFIEKPGIWERMENRRKMLYYIAKSEYYRQEGVHDLSLVNANEAKRIAEENNWTAELPNILDLIDGTEQIFLKAEDKEKTDDFVHSLLENADTDSD